MESVAGWQTVALFGLLSWIALASYINITHKLRSSLQPWVTQHVVTGAPLILRIQKYQNSFFDALFSGLSCIVSVPFYTAFLPLLFWSGHGKLARQMTLLMAFCDYLGNSIKDVISAPRPSCPPVRRITATKDEEENAMEYGLPSSHTLNTVCLSGVRFMLGCDFEQNSLFILGYETRSSTQIFDVGVGDVDSDFIPSESSTIGLAHPVRETRKMISRIMPSLSLQSDIVWLARMLL
uniref:Phosphatidic acid phosphatase type 2/haloperoxidase domain-containing protein n=1 Tax=Cucumis sativus TaxID=3659 RepID=A0A0A0L2L6_CUCSA